MDASPLLQCILIFLLVRTVRTNVKLEAGCIKYNKAATITCTLEPGVILDSNAIFWKYNGSSIVSNGDVIGINPKYGTTSSGTAFSLIIRSLALSDIGIYTCEQLDDLELNFNLEKSHFEDITCNAAGGTKEMVITIEYNNKVLQKPVAEVDGKSVTCVDVSTSAGEPTTGTCTVNNLAAGTYTYTVNNHGECDLTCTGQVTVTASGQKQMSGDIALLIALLLMFFLF